MTVMRGYHIRIKVDESDSFIPCSIFDKLPSITEKKSGSKKKKDYRFGPIRVDWLDKMNKVASFKQERAQGSFNLPDGIVHIYREGSNSTNSTTTFKDGTILGVLAVPSWMTPSDFLSFIAPAADTISHLRIIHDSLQNRSIALISFPKQEHATEFAQAYNGKPFNSMEPEICNVVHVLSVSISSDSDNMFSSTGVYELPTCPVCLERMDSAVTGLITVPCSHTFHCTCLSKWGDSRCPVCRYSQTLLSSHPRPQPSSSTTSRPSPFFPSPSFTSASSTSTTAGGPPGLSTCSDPTCTSTTNLWICLICGSIGCGRYRRGHAESHYQKTTHLYALELETQRVWDYAGDGYVHRLIQNRADGKLVELPSAAAATSSSTNTGREGPGGLGPSEADALTAEKIEAIGIEYSYLLTSQLDSQRSYYEEQTTEMQSQIGELRQIVERLSEDIQTEKLARRDLEEEKNRSEQARELEMKKERTKVAKMQDSIRQLQKNLEEEKAVSEGLLNNVRNLQKEKQSKAATDENHEQEKSALRDQIKDLEDQLRDVMFFLEAQEKIKNSEDGLEEAAGGSVVIPETNAGKGKKKGKGSRRKG
ncbi:zf-UBP-domain-containing protein [Marasmius fiardii PR-910]|nr:zf-UBP-domain-containing protein [Marasmius fiardii PR-910]